MKRRNFLNGLLGTGAAVVAAPVIAKVSLEPFAGVTPDGWAEENKGVLDMRDINYWRERGKQAGIRACNIRIKEAAAIYTGNK